MHDLKFSTQYILAMAATLKGGETISSHQKILLSHQFLPPPPITSQQPPGHPVSDFCPPRTGHHVIEIVQYALLVSGFLFFF